MRSMGKCVRAVAGAVFVLVVAGALESPARRNEPVRATSAPLPPRAGAAPIRILNNDAKSAPSFLRAANSRVAAAKPHASGLTLPLVFEQNVGQAPENSQFIGRGGAERYLLTRDGVRIENSRQSSDDAITLQFVDVSKPQAPKPRKHSGGSKGKSHRNSKSRHKSSRRSSHPAGAESTRPRDATPPSASRANDDAHSNVAQLRWTGVSQLASETNYFLGSDSSNWHPHVANFERAEAANVVPGIDVVIYGTAGGAEYDVRVAPGAEPSAMRLAVAPASTHWRIDNQGDLVAMRGGAEIRMRRPVAYELVASSSAQNDASERHALTSRYELHADGTIGFDVDGRDPNRALVIDPALTVSYFTFLGGQGADSAASVAVDANGFLYVSGTTTSARTIPSVPTATQGLGGGASDYFVAKIDPRKTGAASLVYLTFVGGSGTEAGGKIAIDAKGDVALAGITTSYDFPVTDGSTLTQSAGATAVNDVSVTEIDPTGAHLLYSTLFGGNGNEGNLSSGGVAFYTPSDPTKPAEIFVAMDTNSTNLPVYPPASTNTDGSAAGAYQAIYGGGASDGFFAIFNPSAAKGVSAIAYCTYLGIYGHATVTGVAVDVAGNAYLAGTTNDPNGSFTATNGFQPTYGGGPTNAFVMKLLPSGNASQDLSYGTFLGGSSTDQALAIAVSASLPGTVYLTGSTASPNFPVNGSIPAFQPKIGASGATNAFVAVISQAASFKTSLLYSSFLGGEKSDAGNAIFLGAQGQLYVAGSTSSVYFPWVNNVQPVEGATDAFVAEVNLTPPANGALQFSTPLGGSLAAHANAVAADAANNVYVAGDSSSPDFPAGGITANGFQTLCQSCSSATPLSDAFVMEISQGAQPQASLAFNVKSVSFGNQPIASTTVPPQAVAIFNRGDAPLNVSAIQIGGTNSADFPLTGTGSCLSGSVAPNGECSLEIGFVPSVCGAEAGELTFTDDAAGNPQTLPILGTGGGITCALSASTTNLNFGTAPVNGAPQKQTVTITNIGTDTLENPQIAVTGAIVFAISGKQCGTLSPGNVCTVTVGFAPTAAQSYTGQLSVSFTGSGQQATQLLIALTGMGGTGTPTAGVSPLSILFPAQAVNSQAAPQTVTVANSGTAPLTISGATLTGSGATAFAISAAGGAGCTGSNATVAVGGTCTLTLTFSPASAGSFAAALTISDNAANSPQIIPVQGSGTSPSLAIAPMSAAFGTNTMGIASSAVPITIANSGTSTIQISSVTLTGTGAADFSAPNNCVPVVAAGKSCTISVSFNPTQTGTRSATLQISDSAPQSPQMIAVTGSAVQAQMTVTPTTGTFASQLSGTASAPTSFTVTNTAASPAMLSVTSASVGNSPDFQISSNGCAAPVAAGGTCKVSVVFDPSATGATPARSGSLVIASNAGANPQITIPLTGSAADFELGPALSGGTAQTVTGGRDGDVLAGPDFDWWVCG